MKNTALIVAGGLGRRMGSATPKQFLDLCGLPVAVRTMRHFLVFDEGIQIVLVLHRSLISYWLDHRERYFSEVELGRIDICEGGSTRTESVFAGLDVLVGIVGEGKDVLVAIHDAVRPMIDGKLLGTAYGIAEEHGASVASVPVKSSLRMLGEGGSTAVDRSKFHHVQTPQTFILQDIYEAYMRRPHNDFTDDASLYEDAGHKVFLCEGSYDNLKITTPEDLIVASELLKGRGLG